MLVAICIIGALIFGYFAGILTMIIIVSKNITTGGDGYIRGLKFIASDLNKMFHWKKEA